VRFTASFNHPESAFTVDALQIGTEPLAVSAIPGVTPPDHVVIVIEENHSFSQIIGSSSAPYINSLARQGALFTQSFAVTHPSQPNYIDLFSGSNQGVTNDSCPHTFSAANLGEQLIAAGLTFAGFSEDLPAVGSTVCSSGSYMRKHNPWVDFTNVPSSANRPFTSFPTDFTTLPTLSFVIPNQANDMHDGTIGQADTWLRDHIDGYVQFAKTHNSLLIFTFDEDNGSEGNRIATFFFGPMVRVGQFSERINHFNVLRTLEDLYGLPHAGSAANATPITDVWQGAVQPDFTVSVSPTSATIQRGSSGSTRVTVASQGGFSAATNLSASGLPAGVSASFSTNPVTPPANGSASSTVTFGVSSTAAAGTSTITITGTSGSTSHSTTFSLTVGAPPPPGSDVFFDDFETDRGWAGNPNGTDTAATGLWERGDPEPTTSGGVAVQVGSAASGANALITGLTAGASAGANDVDGGVTSIQSPAIALPSGARLTLSFAFYLAHTNNATADDFFRVSIVGSGGTTAVFQELGTAANDAGAFATTSADISRFAGQTIRILVEAADNVGGSLLEAGIDDVRITQQATVFSDDFETDKGWTRNPSGADTAATGLWERGDPQPTTSGGVGMQVGNAAGGVNALITGLTAGASAGDNDVDGGVTSIQSPAITLPSGGTLTLSFNYYLAHLSNSTADDFFRVSIVGSGGTSLVFQELGTAAELPGAFKNRSVDISSFAGQTIRILVQAADGAGGSLIEAGLDDVTLTQR
jgi:phosphoesterase family protein